MKKDSRCCKKSDGMFAPAVKNSITQLLRSDYIFSKTEQNR